MKYILSSFALLILLFAGCKNEGQGSVSELNFDDTGKPTKLVLGGEDMLRLDSLTGFFIRYVKDIHLSKVSILENIIKVSDSYGKLEFTFQIDAYENHLAIHLLNFQGIGNGENHSLRLEFDSKPFKNPLIKVKGHEELSIKGEIKDNEYMRYEGGSIVQVYDCNWNLLRSLLAITKSFSVNKVKNTVTTMATNGLKAENLRGVGYYTRAGVRTRIK